MKKTISIVLSVLILISAVAGLDFSAMAGYIFGTRGDGFDPQGGEYLIQSHWNQYKFCEDYLTCEQLATAEYNFPLYWEDESKIIKDYPID